MNWLTVLRKREAYREAFDGFNARIMAGYGEGKVAELLQNSGIIRNRQKLRAAVNNAQRYLELCSKKGSLSDYLWDFVDGEPIVNHFRRGDQVPATTPLSDTISQDMKRRGFKFFGSTICYAHMQATGMVNDHLTSCFRHAECQRGNE